jgi:hypothetical protein
MTVRAMIRPNRISEIRSPIESPVQATARTILAKCIYIALAFWLKKHKHPA